MNRFSIGAPFFCVKRGWPGRPPKQLCYVKETILMDRQDIDPGPFADAAKNVFHTMLGLQLHVDAGERTTKTDAVTTQDISGIIGLSGGVIGAVIISFPSAVACRVASAFAGIEMTEDHEDFADAIGELTSMIAGNAKKDLTGLNVMTSLPSVIVGAAHIVKGVKYMPTYTIYCSTEVGSFVIEVAMKKVEQTQSHSITANVE